MDAKLIEDIEDELTYYEESAIDNMIAMRLKNLQFDSIYRASYPSFEMRIEAMQNATPTDPIEKLKARIKDLEEKHEEHIKLLKWQFRLFAASNLILLFFIFYLICRR